MFVVRRLKGALDLSNLIATLEALRSLSHECPPYVRRA
jgi:hypothetical protein